MIKDTYKEDEQVNKEEVVSKEKEVAGMGGSVQLYLAGALGAGDWSNYHDIRAPQKNRKAEFVSQGYEVLSEDDADLILVGLPGKDTSVEGLAKAKIQEDEAKARKAEAAAKVEAKAQLDREARLKADREVKSAQENQAAIKEADRVKTESEKKGSNEKETGKVV